MKNTMSYRAAPCWILQEAKRLIRHLLAVIGFTLLAGQAAFAQSVVAPTCPQGYVLSGSQCVASTPVPTCPAGFVFSQGRCAQTAAPTAPPIRRAAPTPVRPVNLALPLQQELKRLGCLTGRVDGVWGGGSRAALNRFNNQIGTSYGSEPSQFMLDEARKRKNGFCTPVRAAPKRKKPVASTSDWDDLDCNDLWYERNQLFALYGHCFKSARGKAAFHNKPDYPNVCKPPHGKLPANAKADVAAIEQVERRKGCR